MTAAAELSNRTGKLEDEAVLLHGAFKSNQENSNSGREDEAEFVAAEHVLSNTSQLLVVLMNESVTASNFV